MILKRWLSELSFLEKEFESWEPADDPSRRIRGLHKEFLSRFDEGIVRLARELEARQAEKIQLEIALCFSDDAVSVTDENGEIRLVNPAFERITGYAGELMIGATHDRLLPKTDEKQLADMKAVIESGGTWRGELRLLTRSGDLLITEATVGPIINHKGAITHYVFTQRDITARAKAERELNDQKDFLEKIVNLTSNVILVLGPNGRWFLDNLSAKTLFTDMGKEGRRRLAQVVLRELTSGAIPKPRRISITLASGKTAYYLVQAERIPAGYLIPGSKAGNLYLVTMTNVSELERKNREILVRQKAISSLRKERGLAQDELANGFVYKMGQPLNVARAIVSRMDTLTSEMDINGLKSNLALLQNHLDTMEDDLKEFKRISRPAEFNGSFCKASDLFEFVEVIYGARVDEESIRLLIEPAAKTALIPAPEEVMRMSLATLFDNAIDSVIGAERRTIRLRFETMDHETSVMVEDSGPGVHEKEAYRIFEPFHTTKGDRQGLSLALASQMVNKAGGRIDLGRSPLGGAMFSISFPVEE